MRVADDAPPPRPRRRRRPAGARAALRRRARGQTSRARSPRAASCDVADAAVLIAYHDCLLCLLAYPETRALRDAARAELQRVAARRARHRRRRTGARARETREQRHRLDGRDDQLRLGHRPLARRSAFPTRADIDSFGERRRRAAGGPRRGAGADGIRARRVRRRRRSISSPTRARAAAARASPGSSARSSDCRAAMRCAASCSKRCNRSSSSGPARSMLSRTFVRGLPAADVLPPRRAPARRRSAARCSTVRCPRRGAFPQPNGSTSSMPAAPCSRRSGRETDAIALACPDGVRVLRARRAASRIALYTMRPERRSPLDSHVGMMLFKNGVPGRLRRRLAVPRHVQDRRQRVRAVPRRRIGAAVRAGAARLPAVLRRRTLRRRALAVRRHQQGGVAVRRVLVLLPARIPPGRSAERRGARDDAWARMRGRSRAIARRSPSCGASPAPTSSCASTDVPDCEPGALSDAVTRWIGGRFGGDRTAAEARGDAQRRPRARRRGTGPLAGRRARARSARSRRSSRRCRTSRRWPAADKRASSR